MSATPRATSVAPSVAARPATSAATTARTSGAGDAWGYRPALDGLRTVAVYLVVLFHAGLVRFENGYVGVDVFFVLSGFLVTNVVIGEHAGTGRVRLARFYARRIRRLLPAAVVMVVAVCAATVLVLPRLERAGFVGDARAALLYGANWHFLGDATDYFADDVDRSPFLHFWSLAIEEQFYVVYPLVLVALLAIARRARRPSVVPVGLALLTSVSLAAQLVVARSSSLDAYYATHTRLYQLLIGATFAAAWPSMRTAQASLRRRVAGSRRTVGGGAVTVGLLGLVILASDVWSMTVSHRGVAAAALAVLLVVALEAVPTSSGARLLSRRAMTYLGRISYGTYLWHWPMIVLIRAVHDPSALELAVVVGVGATGLSALSFRVLETPVRRTPRLATRPQLVVALGLSCSVVAAVVAAPTLLRSERRPVIGVDSAAFDLGRDRRGAELAAALDAPAPSADELDTQLAAAEPPPYDPESCDAAEPESCVLRRGSGAHLHLIGDSNAIVLIPVFLALAEEHDLSLSASVRVGCPWQDGLGWVSEDERLVAACGSRRAGWYDEVVPALDPDLIIAAHVPRDEGSRVDGALFAATGTAAPPDADARRRIVASATEASLERLTAGGASVVLLEPLPYDVDDPAVCLSGAVTVGACAYEVEPEPFPTELVYRAIDDRRADVVAVDIDALACPFLPVCLPMVDGSLVFRNQFHLGNSWLLDHTDAWWQLIVAADASGTGSDAAALRRSAPATAGTR